MATYPLVGKPSISYQDHLLVNQYVSDIKKGLKSYFSQTAQSNIQASMQISDTLNSNFQNLGDRVSNDINQVGSDITNAIDFGLDKVCDGIASLRADFRVEMGLVVAQFEMMRQEMNEGFVRIVSALENTSKLKAKEHFKDAMDFYRDGCKFPDNPQWFIDALKHFLISVETYERNPIAHLHIGHIYHYKKEHQNFQQALNHYRLCYTYGEANNKDYQLAAQGYFYSGWIEAAINKSFDQAITLTKRSLEFDNKLGEAHYHLAKFYAAKNNVKPAIKHLESAIKMFDRNYFLKALSDTDFNTGEYREYLNSLNTTEKQKIFKTIATYKKKYSDSEILSKTLVPIQSIVEDASKIDTYPNYLDANKSILVLFSEMETKIQNAEKKRIMLEKSSANAEKTKIIWEKQKLEQEKRWEEVRRREEERKREKDKMKQQKKSEISSKKRKAFLLSTILGLLLILILLFAI